LVALTLDKNRLCEHIQSIGTDFVCLWKGVCLLASSIFDKEKWAALACCTKMHCFQSKARGKKKRERENLSLSKKKKNEDSIQHGN
jgi:hypothetical protein